MRKKTVRKLSKREQGLLIIFFFILMAVIGIEFIVTPSLDKITVLKSERADLQLQWDEIQSYRGTEDILNSRVKELKSKNMGLSQQLLPAQSSHQYWEFINKNAEQSGVNIVQIQEDNPEYKTNSRLIHLSFTGDFSETVTFIEAINSMPYIHAISEGAFQSGDELISTTLTLYISAFQGANGDQIIEKQSEPKELSKRNPFEMDSIKK